MIVETANCPLTLLLQHNDCWPGAPFSSSKKFMSGRRHKEYGTCSDDKSQNWTGRGKEEIGGEISEARLLTLPSIYAAFAAIIFSERYENLGLMNDGEDVSRDEIHLGSEADWNDRLNDASEAKSRARPDAEVIIGLNRNADQTGNRICQLFSQVLCSVRRLFPPCL